jgi:hypothetical protein
MLDPDSPRVVGVVRFGDELHVIADMKATHDVRAVVISETGDVALNHGATPSTQADRFGQPQTK